jgi:hypothetical protein
MILVQTGPGFFVQFYRCCALMSRPDQRADPIDAIGPDTGGKSIGQLSEFRLAVDLSSVDWLSRIVLALRSPNRVDRVG